MLLPLPGTLEHGECGPRSGNRNEPCGRVKGSISDDGTMAFMDAFYDRFLKGAQPQQALQETQDAFIKSKQWNHPLYWAPIVMVGKDQ